MKLARKLAILVAVCAALMATPLGDAGAVTPTPTAQNIDACGLITAAEVQSLSGQTVALHSERDTCEIFFPGPDTGAGGGQINIFVYTSAANAKRSFHKGKSEDAGVRTIKVPKGFLAYSGTGISGYFANKALASNAKPPTMLVVEGQRPRGVAGATPDRAVRRVQSGVHEFREAGLTHLTSERFTLNAPSCDCRLRATGTARARTDTEVADDPR